MSQEIDTALKSILIDRLFLDFTVDELDVHTPLEDYGVDSFLLQEMLVGIEEEFGIRVTPDDMKAEVFTTLSRVRVWIESKRNA